MIQSTRKRPLLIAAAVLVLAIAGCGGSSGVSPAAYVKSVCTAATTWRNAIQSAGSQLQIGSASKSLTKTKAAYASFVSELETATANAQHQLSGAGSPSVSDGKKISDTLVGIFARARVSLEQAASDAAAIPTTSTQGFNAAATKVEGQIRTALADMSNATPEKNPQLHTAATKDPTCQALASSSG